MTLPILTLLQLSVGAAVAFVGRKSLLEGSWWRSPALLALVPQGALATLLSGYFLARYGDWSVSYLASTPDLSFSPLWLALACPAASLLGFMLLRAAYTKQKRAYVGVVLLLPALLAGAVGWLERHGLVHVGSTLTARAAPDALHSMWETPLPLLMVAAGLAYVASVGATSWRVFLLARARKPQGGSASKKARPVAEPGAKTMPPRAKAAKGRA